MSVEVVLNSSLQNNMSTEATDFSKMNYPGDYKYKPMWEVIIKTFFYVPVIVFGIIGNVIIIVVVIKNKRMQVS